ncbi:MAG: TerB family tellurite resistance protein, partial [Pseudomonadota bacterium]
PSHTIDDILTPLAIAVVIDHKVREVEETAFAELADGLLELFGYKPMGAKAILKWFDDHQESLEDQLWEKGGNTMVLRALTRFKKPVYCEAIYDALVSIAVADKEYVPEESRLIKSAASIYGYQRPPIPITRN